MRSRQMTQLDFSPSIRSPRRDRRSFHNPKPNRNRRVSLKIAVAQPAFQNHLGTLRAQTPLHGNPFIFGLDKKLSSSWKSSDIMKKLNFNLGHVKTPKSRLLIQAVAIFETKSLVHNENGHMGYKSSELDKDSSPWTVQPESSREDSSEMDDKEKLRRMRISKANKGNTPWNKGRKHSPETLRLIKERTRLAMQDPKVKMKLVNLGHAQTEETRTKIGIGVRMGWQKRRQKLSLQENCCYEWQNLIAEASRQGYDGEEELQWDSYKMLDELLKEEYKKSIEQRKIMRRPKGSKRAPKSLEQRRKISQAISAKWNDPGYRERVCSALSKYYDASYGAERKPRKRPPRSTESTRSPTKKKVFQENKFSRNEIKLQKLRSRRSKEPMYKDPLASSKMEMIKNIRAQRAATETKTTEAIERARLLIAEAEKAAMALEASATKSPVARASLIETRQLIAEAIRSIDSIETMQFSSHENEEPSVTSGEVISQREKENWSWGHTEADNGKINGTLTFSSDENEKPLVPSNEVISQVKKETGICGLTEADNVKVNGTEAFSFHEIEDPLLASNEVLSQREKETYTGFGGLIEAYNGKVNGTKTLSSVEDKDLGFGEFLQDMLNDEDDLLPMSPDGDALPPFNFEQSDSSIQSDQLEPNGNNECNNNLELHGAKGKSQGEDAPSTSATVTKKWVRGRLIEVPEEA